MGNEIYIGVVVALVSVMLGIPVALIVRGQKFIVPEGFLGLLYRYGKSRHRLSPGKHRFWRGGYEVRLIDMRQTILTVAGQEVLSADNVGLKLSAALTYQIAQPEK